MDEQNIKQHFRPDEAPLIDQVGDWVATAEGQYRPVLTPFLNPRERFIARTIVNRNNNVKIKMYGGWQGAEMQRVLIYPPYYEPSMDDFALQVLELNYPTKFSELHHRQIMGTLIGEGMERNAFGDILTDGHRWQVIVTRPMATYLRKNVDHVGRIKVKWVPVDETAVVEPLEEWVPLVTTVSSLRLDVVVSAGFNYSRNRAKQLIEHGQVRLNWEEIDRPDYQVVVHDLISVRHAGRLRIDMTNGKTKKDKERVTISVVNA
jgi:RNA-binding protein YlmH